MEDRIILECAEKYDGPFYLYEKQTILNNYRVLSETLWEHSKIFFSMKSNPLAAICRLLLDHGAGIEAASMGEIQMALLAGANPADIIFTSPGKTVEELEYAVQKNIKIINVESLEEIRSLDRIASRCGKIAPVALRINPDTAVSNARIKMTGVPSQFGIEENNIDAGFIAEIKSMRNIELLGIQVYMGTNMLKAEDIIQNTKYILKLALSLEEKFQTVFSYVNFGGGFGVPYFKNETELDMGQMKREMDEIWQNYSFWLQGKELIFESGRYIMASAGYYVVRVLYKKESKEQKYLVCNGGSNYHSASAFLGRFVRNNFPMYVLGKKEQTLEKVNVVGPLCTPTDILGKEVELSCDANVDDYIVIEMSGAYGLTFSPCFFLGHGVPYEILYDGEKTDVLRKRERADIGEIL